MIPRLKILGERNSGTTYLQQLLAANVQATLLPGTAPPLWRRLARGREWPIDLYFRLSARSNLGWKHQLAAPPARVCPAHHARPRVAFVIITKNPYAWLLSLFRHPYHYQSQLSDFETFLRQPWATVARENHPQPFANPIELWNAKHQAYEQLARHCPCLLLRYEDLLADPAREIRRIAQQFNLRQNSPFTPIRASAKGESHKDFSFYQDYYLAQRWRQALSQAQIHLINRTLNPQTVAAMGYSMLPSS